MCTDGKLCRRVLTLLSVFYHCHNCSYLVCVSLTVRTLVTFYVVNVVDNKRQVRLGVQVVSTLAKRLHSSTDAFDFRVVELDTVGKFSAF